MASKEQIAEMNLAAEGCGVEKSKEVVAEIVEKSKEVQKYKIYRKAL